MVSKNILEEYTIRVDRVHFNATKEVAEIKELNEYQEKALVDIKSSFDDKKVTLLKGVTSSGKTEVYVKLIEECLL